jgi:glycerophosphoryl diester phosphodiesterase
MKIIAHRGASARAPENTLAAVRLAVELDADGVEVDVRVTRDGQLAVLHDTDTRRVAPGAPVHTVKRNYLRELQTLDIGSWMDPRFAGERIPALGDVLSVLAPEQEIFIEAKSREADAVLAGLSKVLAPSANPGFPAARVVIMSFETVLVRKIKKLRPSWRTLLLLNHKPTTHLFGQILSAIRAKQLDGIGQNRTWTLTPEQYASLLAAGAILSVWTVNNPVEAQAWRDRGFHYLTTDIPDLLKAKLKS